MTALTSEDFRDAIAVLKDARGAISAYRTHPVAVALGHNDLVIGVVESQIDQMARDVKAAAFDVEKPK